MNRKPSPVGDGSDGWFARTRRAVSQPRLVLVSAFVVLLFNSGARFSIGLLLPSMVAELSWSRSTLSLTVTVFMIVSAAALPYVGRLVDRFGARRVLSVSLVISAVGIAAMGLIRSPTEALILYGVVFALGSAGTSITPIGVLLRRWYPARMGMANSIAISGMGLGQLVVISGLSVQLEVIGWRGAFLAVGAAIIVFALPLVLLAGRKQPPEEPDTEPAGMSTTDARASTLRDTLALRSTWLLLAVYAICGFQDFLIATHIVAFAVDEGIDHTLAGNMLAFMGLAGLLGVLATGALNDRYGPVLPTLLCFILRTGIFAVLLFDRSTPAIVLAALLYGTTFWITAPMVVIFARGLASVALLGTVSGIITMVHHASGGLGAWFAARIFDSTGNYDSAFAAMLILSVAAALLALPLRSIEHQDLTLT